MSNSETFAWRVLLIVGFALHQFHSGLVEVYAAHSSSVARSLASSYSSYSTHKDYKSSSSGFSPGEGYRPPPGPYGGSEPQYSNKRTPGNPAAGVWDTNTMANNPNGRQYSGNTIRRNEEKLNVRPNARPEPNQNKCKIWAPAESLRSYKHYTVAGSDRENPMLQLIEICCDGFSPVIWENVRYCRPVCETCRNGFCVAPDQCECFEDFVPNDNGDCVYTCPLGCLNGRCYLDGSCQCNPGFKLDESRKFCRPICSAGCGLNPRHNCTEPEVCGCAKGYQLTDEGCKPTCEPDCGIGGTCEEDNYCRCQAGYTLKAGVCQSECYQSCDNGVCFSRNRCICNPGYKYHEASTMCVPA